MLPYVDGENYLDSRDLGKIVLEGFHFFLKNDF